MSIQIHIDIDFTKLGATAFIISFLRLWCGAHLIHQPSADNVVEPDSSPVFSKLSLLINYLLGKRLGYARGEDGKARGGETQRLRLREDLIDFMSAY